MAYGNYRRSSGGSYGSRRSGNFYGSRRSGGSYGNSGGGYGNQRQAKRSGSKYGVSAKNDNKPYVQAWRLENGQIMTLIASPSDKGSVSEQTFHWTCKVQIGRGKPFLTTGFWNPNTRKLTIPDLGLVASTSKDYFGSFVKSRRR